MGSQTLLSDPGEILANDRSASRRSVDAG